MVPEYRHIGTGSVRPYICFRLWLGLAWFTSVLLALTALSLSCLTRSVQHMCYSYWCQSIFRFRTSSTINLHKGNANFNMCVSLSVCVCVRCTPTYTFVQKYQMENSKLISDYFVGFTLFASVGLIVHFLIISHPSPPALIRPKQICCYIYIQFNLKSFASILLISNKFIGNDFQPDFPHISVLVVGTNEIGKLEEKNGQTTNSMKLFRISSNS